MGRHRLKFRADTPLELTAIRYFKSPSDHVVPKTGYIYSKDGALQAFTPYFDDSFCSGPRWVTVALTAPWRPTVGKEYYSEYLSPWLALGEDQAASDATTSPQGVFHDWRA